MKYFGHTRKKDPFKYKGSGSYWNSHMNCHGWHNLKTIEIWGFDEFIDCQDFAIIFSIENDIVNSVNEVGDKIWANLVPEVCDGAGRPKGYKHLESTKLKYSITMRGRPRLQETKEKISETLTGRKLTPEHSKNIGNGKRGIPLSKEHCKNITIGKTGKKQNLSEKQRKHKSELVSGENNFWYNKKLSKEHTTNMSIGLRKQRSDQTIRVWIHKDGRTFTGINIDMVDMFPDEKLGTQKLGHVVKGFAKQHKGWTLIK